MYPPSLETFKSCIGQDPEHHLTLNFHQGTDKIIFRNLLQTKFYCDPGSNSVQEGLVDTTLLMGHTVERPMSHVGHFLSCLQHQSEIEDDQMQDKYGFTVINKSDYLNGAYRDMKF